jgi:uncharacterized protein with HEPN domain
MSKQTTRNIELFIVDIFVAIEKIKLYSSPFTSPNDFQHSSLHWDASMRQLEIIGEALNKLLHHTAFNASAPSYFRKIVNFRNTIVHAYFGIDVEEVWNIITLRLDILAEDLAVIVKKHPLDISEALACTIKEYQAQENLPIVNYLLTLQNLS